MDYREILADWNRDGNARRAFGGRRKRREECERQMPHGVAEFRTVRSVPGIDRIELFEFPHAGAIYHSHQIQAGVRDRAGPIREPDQRQERPRGPNFGIRGACCFKRGQRENDVADRAGTNQQAAANG
jgi:hypothetical protein